MSYLRQVSSLLMKGGGGGGGGGQGNKQQQQEDRMKQMEDMKNSILSQVLDQEASQVQSNKLISSQQALAFVVNKISLRPPYTNFLHATTGSSMCTKQYCILYSVFRYINWYFDTSQLAVLYRYIVWYWR